MLRQLKLIAALLLGISCAYAAPALTTVTSTLYRGDGTPFSSGYITLTWPTFTSADGYRIPAGSKTVNITTAGVISVTLVPNASSVPVGTSYRVSYNLGLGSPANASWIVPSSGPVTVGAIESGYLVWPPVPTITLSMLPLITVPYGGTGGTLFTANLPILGNGAGAFIQGTRSGNTTVYVTTTGTRVAGNCVAIDAFGNFVDNGAPCGSGGGGGAIIPNTTNVINGSGTGNGADSGIAVGVVVKATSPGLGIAHFAGSTQNLTSSLIVNADIAAATIDLSTKVTGLLAGANMTAMVGDSGSGGTKGAVPAPAAGDASANKFLKADGTWTAVTGTGNVVGPGSSTDGTVAVANGTTGLIIKYVPFAIDGSGNFVTPGTGTFGSGGASLVTYTNGATPATPTALSGLINCGSVIASKMYWCVDDTGAGSHLVATKAAVPHFFVSAITDAGDAPLLQPSAADLSDGNSGTGAICHVTGSTCGNTVTVQSGAFALATGAIGAGTCAITQTATATGTLSTDRLVWTPNASIKAITGYAPSASGGLSIAGYPSANAANWDVCNWTGSPITPGAVVTLNWAVLR